MMTALKALLTGILCLLLLALLAGIVFLASLFLGFELKSLIMPLVALAALVVLFFAGRRAWLYLAGRRFRKTVLATDTRKVASQVVDEANANAMEEACRAGLAHMDAMSLGRNPLVFVLGSAQGNAHGLASALATEAPLEYTVTVSPSPIPVGPTSLLALLYTGVASVSTNPATPSAVVSLST